MNSEALKKYAELIVRVGANVKSGQQVVVRADLDQPEFVKTVVEEAYLAGASKVEVEWSYQPLTKIHVKHRDTEVLTRVEDWEIAKLTHRKDTLPAMIYLLSEDPDGLSGIDREKYALQVQARYKKMKSLQDEMENKYQWCIAAVPGVKWAKKMFPDCSESQAVEKLWQAILYTSRAEGDPIANWKKHNEELEKRCNYLNGLGLVALEYKSENGTDLRVGLMENALFMGGGEYTLSGNFFNANIPSEEVFITPKRGEAEGIVYSTMPLSYRGQLMRSISCSAAWIT